MYMMLIHESHVFGLLVETKFEVCEPRVFFFYYLYNNEEGLKNSGLSIFERKEIGANHASNIRPQGAVFQKLINGNLRLNILPRSLFLYS